MFGPEGAIQFKNLAGFEAANYVFPLKVTYTTLPSYHIALPAEPVRARILGSIQGTDTENNDRLVLIDLYRVSFEMDGPMPLLNEDLASQPLKGDCP